MLSISRVYFPSLLYIMRAQRIFYYLLNSIYIILFPVTQLFTNNFVNRVPGQSNLYIRFQIELMSVILGKYRNKRKLGKGAYGDVLLVEDPNGKQLAIKMISKKIIQKDPYLEQYLEGEKDVMMSVKNRFVMQLYAFEEDDNYKYFICQYCDGGDLLNLQAKQPNKVFDLKYATKILSEVIQGLEILHYKGYLHRDIKPQNILIKKEGGNAVYKLADFGFAKKMEDVAGTVLGTENYMSPEIFSNEIYSYEVDMWAFGVLFYFMLNMQFPFRINPHAQIEQKQKDLLKQATNFNYTQTVKKSKKQIMDNCTEEVNDLFKKIFNPDGTKRITFVEIREHPLFKEYFPVIESQSRILYKGQKKINRYDSFIQSKTSTIQKPSKPINNNNGTANKPTKNEQDNVLPQVYVSKAKTFEQKAQLQAQMDRIQFLCDTADDLQNSFNFVNDFQLVALKYDLLRYYVILMRDFERSLNLGVLAQRYPKLKWEQFMKTPEFNSIRKKAKDNIDEGELKVSQSYNQCQNMMTLIRKVNPELQQSLEYQVKTQQFSGSFKVSYRASTSRIYDFVRQRFSNGNRYPYLTVIIVMCHSFNQLMACTEEELQKLFADFVVEKERKDKPIEFSQVRSWLSKSDKEKIKGVIKSLLQEFFG